jgi:protein-S-isoprenylcysteine O-methyltransferase Ste14
LISTFLLTQNKEAALKKFLFFLYGIVCYLIFFVTFLYAVGFVDNLAVPKSIDKGYQGGTAYAWLVDILLLSLFALQHSIMARPEFKKWWTRIVPWAIERSTYVLFASASLILLFLFWRPLPDVVWDVQNTFLSALLIGFYFFGWFIVLFGTFLINHFNLFGLQQVYNNLNNREPGMQSFVTPLFYRFVRHPIMLGFIVAFWAAPHMTIGHILFSVGTTAYILIAIQLEERDMVGVYGAEYKRYQREVSQIIPMPPKKH